MVVKSDMQNADDEKTIEYAEGIIKHFSNTDENRSLYFNGKFLSNGEPVKRNIKLSKRVKAYESGKNKVLDASEYPKKNMIYRGKIMLETWEWKGYNCMRVLAFEIESCVGENKSYRFPENINPFSKLDEEEKQKDTASS